MRFGKILLIILMVAQLFLAVDVNSIASSDARFVFFNSLYFQTEWEHDIIELLLFPEKREQGIGSRRARWTLLEFACQLDRVLISFAESRGLGYDRDWLLYYLPEPGEVISIDNYCKLLYYATFMPPGYRRIIDKPDYEISTRATIPFRSLVTTWGTTFRMNREGYVYDIFTGEWVYDPIAAEKSIINLRHSIADYYKW